MKYYYLQSYTCQISAFNPTEISHELVVRTKPVLEVTAEEINVVEGQPLSLQCSLLAGQLAVSACLERSEAQFCTILLKPIKCPASSQLGPAETVFFVF